MAKLGYVDGKHFSEHMDEVRRLKRDGDLAEAEDLLLRLVEAAETEAKAKQWSVPPGYYKHLAIIYRKQGRLDDEVAILERCGDVMGDEAPNPYGQRLREVRRLREYAKAADSEPACPTCGSILDSRPSRSRNCPECGERIVVRSRGGAKLLFTEEGDEKFIREEEADKARHEVLATASEIGISQVAFEEAEQEAEPGTSPRDVFWGLANQRAVQAAAEQQWGHAATTYRAMAKFLADENRDAAYLARQAVACELRDQGRYWSSDTELKVVGCDCEACAKPPRRMRATDALDAVGAGKLPEDFPIPHEDCERGVCRCSMRQWSDGSDRVIRKSSRSGCTSMVAGVVLVVAGLSLVVSAVWFTLSTLG